jgi:Ca2+:H+ antiporter
VSRRQLLLAITIVLTVVAGLVHLAFGDVAGSFASAVPLVLVAPVIAIGTDGLAGRFSASVVGILQSAFGNVAELALTIVALNDDLPDVVRIAIAGSILGNAILLGGLAGICPALRSRGRELPGLRFDRQLFSGIATLAVIAVLPVALLSLSSSSLFTGGGSASLSLAAGIGLILLGGFFVYTEVVGNAHRPVADTHGTPLTLPWACTFLATGAVVAALTAEWFIAGFEPAVERLGIPTAFASLVIIPLLGNVAENYVALRYAWNGRGDSAMAVIMHSVVQIATLLTGILVIVSQFVGSEPLTLRFDPVLALALVFALIILWMILHDGEIEPVEAVGLLVTYTILGAAIWVEG